MLIIIPRFVCRRRRDGTRGYLRLSSAPVRDASGKVIAGVAACDDITELIEAEEVRTRMLAAEHATAQMSQLVSNASHELRTPVSSRIGSIAILPFPFTGIVMTRDDVSRGRDGVRGHSFCQLLPGPCRLYF